MSDKPTILLVNGLNTSEALEVIEAIRQIHDEREDASIEVFVLEGGITMAEAEQRLREVLPDFVFQSVPDRKPN
jgi:hypothetical protein